MDQKIREFLYCYLYTYRYTPSYNLGMKSPFELMTDRQVRPKFDFLKPPVQPCLAINSKMESQFNSHNGAKRREFDIGDEVYYQLHSSNTWKWAPGTIKSRNGAVNYSVDVTTPSGRCIVKAHTNQLKRRYGKNELFELFDIPDLEEQSKLQQPELGPRRDVETIIIPDTGNQEINESEDAQEQNDDIVEEEIQGENNVTKAKVGNPHRYPVRRNRGQTSYVYRIETETN